MYLRSSVLNTGGDIFIHAKSSNYSKLYELAQTVMRSLPADSIEKAEDIYGWTYQEGRDLSVCMSEMAWCTVNC